jgi:hypothetical protein
MLALGKCQRANEQTGNNLSSDTSHKSSKAAARFWPQVAHADFLDSTESLVRRGGGRKTAAPILVPRFAFGVPIRKSYQYAMGRVSQG